MTYKPDINQGDWWIHRRTIGIPGVDADWVGVETVPPTMLRGTDYSTNAPVTTGTTSTSGSGTTTSGNTSISTGLTSIQVGSAITGTNIPNAYAVTTADAFDTNQITVGTVTNSSGYTGGFQTGMILVVGATTTPVPNISGNSTVSALITDVSGSTITFDRKINIAGGTRVGAFPVVTSKTSSTVTMSIAASGSGTQTLTYYLINSCSFNLGLIYVPRTINVQHARISLGYQNATVTTFLPMPSDIQDARIMIWGPAADTDQYLTPMTPYAISRNMMSHGETRDRWGNATSSTDIDNSSFFTAGTATLQPITGTGTLTSVSTTTSTTTQSNSGTSRLYVASTTNITTGMVVTSPTVVGIPINTTVTAIGAGYVDISNNLTANFTTGSPATLYFGTLTSVTNSTGYTVGVPGSWYMTGTGIPQGVSTVSSTVSGSTTVTVADASSFQIGMAVVAHNATTGTLLITSISGNTLTLSGSITVSAGVGLYGFVRVNSSTSAGPNASIAMTNAPIASGSVTFSAYPFIGYNPTSTTTTPLYLKVPSGTLKRNQVIVGAGLGTGARISSASPVAGQTNVWLVTFTSNSFTGTPGIPMTHYTWSGNQSGVTNTLSSSTGHISTNLYVYSGGTVVSGGYLNADTRFLGPGGSLTKPALLSGTNIQATITPTYTIRPNYTLDTKYGFSGFGSFPTSTGAATNLQLSSFALANPNPAFSSPVTLTGGYWYYVGLWTGGTAYSSPLVYQIGPPIDWPIGRTPMLASKQYANRYMSQNPGNWSAGSNPSTPTSLTTWNGGYYTGGSAAAAIPFKTVSSGSINGIFLDSNQGYSNSTIPYIALYE